MVDAQARSMIRRSMPWRRFALRSGLALLLVLGAGAYLADRFRFGIDDQVNRCLPPYRFFLIDRHDREVRRDGLFAFAALGMGPYFQDGQTIIKRAAGVPGDRVDVGLDQVRVNGEPVGQGLVLAGTLQRAPTDFLRSERVPAGHFWMMGGSEDSFDARYWGFLPEHRIIGRAYALW
jgi:conjugal transfer pilin signal peptidase TrbI